MTDDSGKVPQSEIDRAKSDIVEVIRRHLPIKKTGKNWSACCPFHQENSASFTVSEEKQMFYCFGCGAGGDAVDFVVQHTGVSFRQAVESINGGLSLESSSSPARPAAPRAITCTLPGHAEDREKAMKHLQRCEVAEQHQYFTRNNTATNGECLTLKGSLIVPIINNIGETVNAAAITNGDVTFAAGAPSFGSTAIIDPVAQKERSSPLELEELTIICADYAHAWRIWWANGCNARVLCTMSADNLSWMLANCRDRFTHVGCDPSQAEEYQDMGHEVVTLPLDPYTRVDRPAIVRQSLMA